MTSNRTVAVVLGAGRVGSAIARDLAEDPAFRVRLVDARADRLGVEGADIETTGADLTEPGAVEEAVEDADLVVGALPGRLGFRTLERVIDAGRDVVDISFFAENPFDLDGAARERDVRALVDAGLAPGLTNLVAGRLLEAWDEVRRFECMVGGLPVDRSAPFEYRAPFSPADVLEEYVRPARIRRGGELVSLPALSEVEEVEVPGVGTLEGFLTDGLRTLLRTTEIPEMVEKTLRYPGHAAAMRAMREAGFFSPEPLATQGAVVSPLELAGRLLTEAWRIDENPEDLVALRITAEGEEAGEEVRRRWWLLDRYDPGTGTTAMARTTGYTCTACVRMLARGLYDEPGVSPLETVGRDQACFDFVVEELAARGVELGAP